MRTSPGQPYPLGTTWNGRGVNFALFSEHATRVELCLFPSDIMWLAPSGQEMSEAEWNAGHVKCLGVRLSGDAPDDVDADGAPIRGETLLYVMNASDGSIPFILPAFVVRPRWETVLETFDDRRVGEIRDGGVPYPLAAHSLAVLRLHSQRWDRNP